VAAFPGEVNEEFDGQQQQRGRNQQCELTDFAVRSHGGKIILNSITASCTDYL